MQEIHLSEHPIQTRRDFFIHMGTIVLGILIAMGLEQIMENVNHSRERQELRESLQQEAWDNIEILHENINKRFPDEQWVSTAMYTLNQAKPTNGMVTVTIPPAEGVNIFDTVRLPSRGVWTGAKTNGQVALLDPSETQAYNRLDYEGEKYLSVTDLLSATEDDCYGFQVRLGVKLKPGQPLKLTSKDRDELVRLFAQLLGHLNKYNTRAKVWLGAAEAIALKVHTYEAMSPYIDCEADSIEDGQTIPPKAPCPVFHPNHRHA